jgi:hypothetical protein
MTLPNDVYNLNLELARQIQDEIFRNPNSPYAGKWIGVAKGQIVAVSEDWEEVDKKLIEVESEPLLRFLVEGEGVSEAEWDLIERKEGG